MAAELLFDDQKCGKDKRDLYRTKMSVFRSLLRIGGITKIVQFRSLFRIGGMTKKASVIVIEIDKVSKCDQQTKKALLK